MNEAVITEDFLLNEKVRLFQPKDGFRSGLDAVLLAASLSGKSDHIADFGTGAGAVVYCAASRLSDARFTGVERDETYWPLFERAREANAASDRIALETRSILSLPEDWQNRFDQVVSNPPYFDPGRTLPPSNGKEGAFLADVPLEQWIKAMLFATKPKGRLTLIHRAGVLGEILNVLMNRVGEIEILPVRAEAGDVTKRVLVTGRKGLKRGETTLHAGLTLYHDKRTRDLTKRAAEIMNGGPLEWR